VRPVLTPAARRLWRGTSTLQLDLTPTRGVLVQGLDAGHRAVLPLLDGVRTREQVVAEAGGRATALLDALEAAGLLLDADDLQVPLPVRVDRHRLGPDLVSLTLQHGSRAAGALRARQAARVVVHGGGRVGAPLARLLAESGVGTVDVRDDAPAQWEDLAPAGLGPQDVGRPRQAALAGRLRSAGSQAQPSVVVLADGLGDRAPEALSRVLVRDRVPHLSAGVSGLAGVVGPLVLPGRSSCLGCQELVRGGIDPDRPALVAAQDDVVLGAAPSHLVLAVAVAAQAALQVLELLEGGSPAAVGGTLELELPGWRWRRRTWPAHPSCHCGATAAHLTASA
jgi:hypothetical protein